MNAFRELRLVASTFTETFSYVLHFCVFYSCRLIDCYLPEPFPFDSLNECMGKSYINRKESFYSHNKFTHWAVSNFSSSFFTMSECQSILNK